MFRKQNLPDSSFPYLNIAKNLSIKNEFTEELAKTYNNIGAAFSTKKDFDSAFVYMKKSLDIKLKLNKKKRYSYRL